MQRLGNLVGKYEEMLRFQTVSAKLAQQPRPGRHERAVKLGSAIGRATTLGTAAFMGPVVGAVPGGALAVVPVSRGVGAISRMAATGAHLAGNHIAESGAGRQLAGAGRDRGLTEDKRGLASHDLLPGRATDGRRWAQTFRCVPRRNQPGRCRAASALPGCQGRRPG